MLKFNLVTKITILALSIFLVTAILIQLIVHTQTLAIIESEQEKAYEQLLDLILMELNRKNQLLEMSSARKAHFDSFKNEVLDDLQQSYLLNNDRHADIFIVDESGFILLHPHLPRGNGSLAHLFTPAQFAGGHGKLLYQDSAGDEQWAFFVRFPEWQWIVCYTVPVKNKIVGFSQFNQHLAFIIGGAFIIMGLALAYFLSKVLKPVSKLTRAANAIAEGYMDKTIDINGTDEIGTLARSFEQMQQALTKKISQLRKSEFKYRSLIQYANSVILRWDKKGRVIFLNDFGQKLFGFRQEEIVGKNVVGTIIAEKEATGRELTEMIDDILKKPERYIVNENENVCRDGRRVWLQWSNNAIVDEQDNFLEMLSVGIDITEKKATEKLLNESENRYRALFESANDAIFIRTSEGICIDCNRKAQELIGCSREELIGHPPEHIAPSTQPDGTDSQQLAQQIISKALAGAPQTMEWQVKRTDGGLRDVIAKINSFTANSKKYIQANLSDITRQKRMETELRQAQKMEGIGTLAGGIAHDFNNILSAIIGYTELALMKTGDDPDLTEDLKQVRKASERAKELVRQILSFSRKDEHEKTILQVNLIVKEALKLIRSSIPSTIEIVQDISTRAAVLTDPTQIHQLIMNLCTNAYQAMVDTGGKLSVSMHEVSVKPNDIRYPELPVGDYVHIGVSDTGCGMDQATLEKIFDPFFTTKEQGRGTGLGLAVVYDIVQGHEGKISVRSKPGAGTTFDVFLPVAQERLKKNDRLLNQNLLTAGNERIMIVDDEEAIRDLLHAILSNAGYQVEEYANGREAWEVFRQSPEDWSLIITDQTMPQMTGEELAVNIMKLQPDIPIILCTGYSESISIEKARKLGIKSYLYKPLSLDELLISVHKLLNHKQEPVT